MATNQEIVRTVVKSDIGTAGAGLLSPEQFGAFHELAAVQNPWMQAHSMEKKSSESGGIPRVDFGDDVLRSAEEAVDSGEFVEPDYDFVAYLMAKMRLAFKYSNDTLDQNVNRQRHERELIDGFTRAYGRSFMKLAWLGDTASANPALNFNDGWIKQMLASGSTVDGSLINGGDISLEHLYAMVAALPEAWKQRINELAWAISPLQRWNLSEYLSNRATGSGDRAFEQGADGHPRILGIRAIEVPCLTTQIALTSPRNTTSVMHENEFRLRKVTEGITLQMQDSVAWVGFAKGDFVLREPEGTVVCTGLNT